MKPGSVLQRTPPDTEDEALRRVESSEGQSRPGGTSQEPAEEDSDSGDSLFITQKPAPVPLRLGRRRGNNKLSHPKDLEENEDDSSSSSGEEPPIVKYKYKSKPNLPKYIFPFIRLKKGTPKDPLYSQNKALIDYGMGGFFKCVREQWQAYQRNDDVASSLPTVDMKGSYIFPLSDAEERSEDEDIRVVDKKCFVEPSKRISRQTWCTHPQRRWTVGNAGEGTSSGAQAKLSNEIPRAEASVSRATQTPLNTGSSDDGGSSPLLDGEGRNDEHGKNNSLPQKEIQTMFNEINGAKNWSGDVTEEKRQEGDIPDSKQNGKKTALEHFRQEGDGNLESDANMEDSVSSVSCNLGKVGKKAKEKDRRDEDVEQLQSSTADEFLNDHAEIRKNKTKRKRKETVIVGEQFEGNEASNGTSDLPPMSTNCGFENTAPLEETLESSYVKIKRHKKKRRRSSMEVQDGEEGVDVSFSNDAETLKEMTGTPRKKKKRKRSQDVDRLLPNTAADALNDAAAIQTKKKKRKKEEAILFGEKCEEEEASNRTSDLPLMSKEQCEQSRNGLENTATSETLEGCDVKRKNHKMKQQSSSVDVKDGKEGVDVSVSNDPGTLEEGTGTLLKKKKKKKRRKISGEDVDQLQPSMTTDPLNDDAGMQTKKEANPFSNSNTAESEKVEQSHVKRKKHKKRQSASNDAHDGGVDESSFSGVSFKKKKKKKKTLFSSDVCLLSI